MYHDLHGRGREAEQPAGFDHFKALVHQRSRINRDALAHLPSGMIQRLLRCNVFELRPDRKSTRLNSSHANISYAVFCLNKKLHHPFFIKASPASSRPMLLLPLVLSTSTATPSCPSLS